MNFQNSINISRTYYNKFLFKFLHKNNYIFNWINLYIGIYLKGEKGKEYKNLFMVYSYDNVIENNNR